MTWTYSGDPSTSELDAIRFEIGDTRSAMPLLSDEEIEYAISQEANKYSAAARCCEAIVAKFSMDVDKTIGKTKVSASQRVEQYQKKAETLRKKGMAYSGAPYAGGISVSEREKNANDPTLIQPTFTKGMNDNPEAGPPPSWNRGGRYGLEP